MLAHPAPGHLREPHPAGVPARGSPSLEKAMQVSGIESNYMLIKKFEPYLTNISDPGTFFAKIATIIDTQLPEFKTYKQQINYYLALYFNIGQE